MAVVQRPLAARQQTIFESVFSAGSVRPPPNRQQFEASTEQRAEQVYQTLLHDSRSALGIDDVDCRFLISEDREFCSYFPESDLVDGFPCEPGTAHYSLLEKWHALHSFKILATWRRELGVARLGKIFAAVIDKVLSAFVEWSYSRNYGVGALDHLTFWINHVLSPYSTQFLQSIQTSGGEHISNVQNLEKWKEMALTRLATLRVNEMFEMVIEWDESAPGIEDLKSFTTNPATRSYVTSSFANVINTRLLQPGASTIEILQVYISIIRAFRRLDPKGVLLERVARRLRRYLRERDDTIKVVVTGLLSDFELQEDGQTIVANPDVLAELAHELQQRDSNNDGNGGNSDLDWNNMEWMPDPIDAAPDYLRSQNTDVIGSVISLFESKDIFVRELQTALAERLLQNKTDFDQEISVIEHLKMRFDDNALQACEVMLRDVLDSRKLDQVIRQDQGLDIAADVMVSPPLEPDSEPKVTTPSLHAKILSRLFWPSLPTQPFRPPVAILEQRNRYEKGFESLKQNRKLTWNDAIGHVQIELALADRVVEEEVLPYQATVIYAFQDQSTTDTGTEAAATTSLSVTRTVEDLASELAMSPALVRSACLFWLNKRVLHQPESGVFAVLETLPLATGGGETQTTSPAAAAAATAASSSSSKAAAAAAVAATLEAEQSALRVAEQAERRDKLRVYHQFVVSMLTNQGAMPLPRIAMMLGIVVPGGFPFSNEELREFLAGMVREGLLEIGPGGNYKVAS